jgi:tRNA dimethylallyltransferase
LGPTHELLRTMGTEEALAVADGAMTTTVAQEQVAARTRQYARRQRTWFKKEPWWQALDASSPTLVDDALTLLRA